MSRHARRRSLGTRLTWIIVATSSAALLLGALFFAVYDWNQAKQALIGELHIVADVLGTNMRSALEFDDRGFAADELEKLSTHDHVLSSRLFASDGTLFAEWTRAGHSAAGLPAHLEDSE